MLVAVMMMTNENDFAGISGLMFAVHLICRLRLCLRLLIVIMLVKLAMLHILIFDGLIRLRLCCLIVPLIPLLVIMCLLNIPPIMMSLTLATLLNSVGCHLNAKPRGC